MSIVEKGKATQFRSGKQAAENGKKGGIASGKSRKKNKDMREVLQKLMDGTYSEEDGKKLSGMDIVMTSPLSFVLSSFIVLANFFQLLDE